MLIPREMILSGSLVGREITLNHTVKRLFPSQFSLRISNSVSSVQEKVQLGAHTFNTSLPFGLSSHLRRRERAGALRWQAGVAKNLAT